MFYYPTTYITIFRPFPLLFIAFWISKKIHFISFCFRQLTEYFFAKSTLSDDDNGKKPAKKKLEAQDKASDRPGRFSAQGEEGLDPIPPYTPCRA